MKIYLAGPLGFFEAGRLFHETVLIPKLRELGFETLDPWKLINPAKFDRVRAIADARERRAEWRKLNWETGATNRAAIDAGDLLLAVLDGSDVDSGTAAEIGYGFATGKPIIGYRSDSRLCGDNEGAVVNLQVEYFIGASGGKIFTGLEDLCRELERRIGAAGGKPAS